MRRTILLSGVCSFIMAFLGGVLAFGLVVPTMVEAQQNRLRAESVTVTGSTGTDRVELSAGAGVNSHVNVLDASGDLRAQMRTGGDGSNPANSDIRLFGPGATGTMDAAVRLGTSADLQATLQLADKNQADRIALDVDPDGSPSIAVRDPDEKDRVRLSQGPNAAASVTVLGLDGTTPRANLGMGGGASGAFPDAAGLNIFAADGTQIVRLGTTAASPGPISPTNPVVDGSLFVLFDGQGRPRIVAQVEADGSPVLVFLDAAGNVTWRAQ